MIDPSRLVGHDESAPARLVPGAQELGRQPRDGGARLKVGSLGVREFEPGLVGFQAPAGAHVEEEDRHGALAFAAPRKANPIRERRVPPQRDQTLADGEATWAPAGLACRRGVPEPYLDASGGALFVPAGANVPHVSPVLGPEA